MNKLSKLMMGIAALSLAACSSDEPNTTAPVDPKPDGDVAYMAITISAPQTAGRATTDGGYVESDLVEAEHKVNSVQFLFFEDNGAYAFTVKADDTTFNPTGTTDPAGNENVEYIGAKNILILNGVRANDYPEYVVTVLNAPADFTAGQTLQETADKLATFANDYATSRECPFVMTTSSFFGGKNGQNGSARHDAKYFATKLNANDFKTTAAEAQDQNTTPVEIYVERLAAKVQLTLAGTVETVDGVKYYKIPNVTLAGGDDNTNGDAISKVDLYTKVIDWRLNATAEKSYMSKKLQSGWETNAVFTDWNKPDDWRSFWAEAYTYGDPTGKLVYTTPKDVTTNGFGFDGTGSGNIQYCYENTNAPKNIFAKVDGGSLTLEGEKVAVENAKVTHVVLHTQIYQKDAEGKMIAPSLVQYRGVLYTESSFKALLLNRLKADGKLNFWRYTGTSTDPTTDVATSSWKTVTDADFEMAADKSADHVLGEIKIVAKKLADGDKIYERTTKTVDGNEVVEYVDITSTFKTTVDNLLAELLVKYPAVGSDTADAFYYIPVEHLAAAANEKNAVEGYYGVVRNHWYNLSINSFKKVGHLVFEPGEDETQIIPEGPEDPLYYVGAKINILSWKVVNQTVEDL